MELRQLRYFVAIADHGSLSRAAAALHIAQPALTLQLKLLEEELSAQLLHRSPRGVLPTEAGKRFYEHAQAILRQVADCKAGVAQLSANPSGTVAIGLPQSVSGMLALPLLKAARAQYPEITIQITEELSGNLIEQLRSGRINLSVLFDDGQLGAFATTPLVEETLMFITARDSRFAPRGSSIGLRRALQSTLILPNPQHGVRAVIEKRARERGLACEDIIEINSIGILKSALMADIGATLQAAAPMNPELALGELCAYALRDVTLARSIALCASREIPLTGAASAIRELLLTVVAEQCALGQWPHARLLMNLRG